MCSSYPSPPTKKLKETSFAVIFKDLEYDLDDNKYSIFVIT